MKKILTCSLLLLSVVMSNSAYSLCIQNHNELSLVGLDSGTGLLYAGTSSYTNECSCNAVRFQPEITDTEMALSILLSAKMNNKRVRIDLLDDNDCNSAIRVYIH